MSKPGEPPDKSGPLPAELNPRAGRHHRRRASRRPSRRRGVRFAKYLTAAVSTLVLIVSGVAWGVYRNYSHQITHLNAIPPAALNHGGKADVDGTDQNILVVGDDSRVGLNATQLKELGTQNDGGSANTDTMMVAHFPANGKRASVVSLPRDLWVDVPGYGMNKLNSAFALGSHGRSDTASRTAGFQLLIRTISGIAGLHIDHFVEVNLWGFYSISKAIGGVPINLCNAVQDHFSGIDLPAGKQSIEGTQALAFVRQRHGLAGGDLDRVHRQQYFLSQAFHKIETAGVLLNPLKLTRLLDAVTTSLSTDPGLDPIKLADQMRGLTAGNLHFTTIPITGEPTIDGLDVITYDPATVHRFFDQIVRPVSTPRPTHSPTTNRAASDPPSSASHHASRPTPTPTNSATNAGCIN